MAFWPYGSTSELLANAKDEINVPIALSAFRDKGSRLWSFEKEKKKKKKKALGQAIDRASLSPMLEDESSIPVRAGTLDYLPAKRTGSPRGLKQ